MAEPHHDLGQHVALAEVLDRVLGKGAVIAGEVTLAVADVDLVRLDLQLVLGTVDAVAPPVAAGVQAPRQEGG